MTVAENSGEDPLEILLPDVDVDVRDPDTGEAIALTVREFRLLDGLRAQAEARGLVAALAKCAAAPDGDDAALSLAIDEAVGGCPDDWVRLISRATGRDAEWIGRLSDAEGCALKEAMWQANGPFFLRRVVGALAAARAPAEIGSPSTGS